MAEWDEDVRDVVYAVLPEDVIDESAALYLTAVLRDLALVVDHVSRIRVQHEEVMLSVFTVYHRAFAGSTWSIGCVRHRSVLVSGCQNVVVLRVEWEEAECEDMPAIKHRPLGKSSHMPLM